MIKLRDIYNSIKEGTGLSGMVAADQMWPFAKKASYAKNWEADRLSSVFDKSLEGMIVHPDSNLSSIVNGNDVDELNTNDLAGEIPPETPAVKNSSWHGHITDDPQKDKLTI